jgi:RNA exonuclease 1
MDCEMVRTTHGPALARLTVVSVDPTSGKTEMILDQFVKPAYAITDYVTRFSGITPETFEDGRDFVNMEEARKRLGEVSI